jgi:hypothetical protein
MAVTTSFANQPEDPEDAAAEAQAAEAREQGTDLIREHLEHHLNQNPGSSYVTWIATLHPENATVTIDPRFMIEGNPWKTVYNETKYGICDRGSPPPEVDAQAVQAVAIPEEKTRSYGGFIDFLVGLIIDITAASLTFSLEVCAIVVRFVARSFEYFYDKCYHYTLSKYTLGVIFWIMWRSFWFCEHVFLYMSVFVTELLAAISFMLCALFALDCGIGRAAHQRTRRLSHLIRWACRRPAGSNNGAFPPQGVRELEHEQVMPTIATAVPQGSRDFIQTATVVSIHDNVESNK